MRASKSAAVKWSVWLGWWDSWALVGVPPVEAMDLLLGKLRKTPSNIMFLLSMSVN